VKKKVLVYGPVLSQSGYGEHARFVLRSLRLREDEFDIHIIPSTWGQTGWIVIDDEERQWIDSRINESIPHLSNKLPYDMSIQVTIPSEWEKRANINIGVTAGIETNKVSPLWLQKANMMDKVITISNHAKSGFDAVYEFQDQQTKQIMKLSCKTPVEVAHYPEKAKINEKLSDIDLGLEYDFNYLVVAQWGPRKNLHNLIKWFVEENYDQEVGLVIKTSLKNNSINDRAYAEQHILQSIPKIADRKCKIYLLHGDMSENEMHSLYQHPKIKAMISLSYGEGFGLPLFEAAYSGLPIIASGWSGHCDFLYMPNHKLTKKTKLKPMFLNIDFSIGPVPEAALWKNVIEKDMMWCYPTEGSYKLRLRQMRNNYDKYYEKSQILKKWVLDEFESNKKHSILSDMMLGEYSGNMEEEIDELFNNLLGEV
jgi:glycosyltransferase involved in cell wall biosynthesis